ncbi:MAG TPA: hypothetical protein VI423_10105, partial [Paenisporosarcina sp.]|nr:hypothetical protein [Paenisporosarcina sp.]
CFCIATLASKHEIALQRKSTELVTIAYSLKYQEYWVHGIQNLFTFLSLEKSAWHLSFCWTFSVQLSL